MGDQVAMVTLFHERDIYQKAVTITPRVRFGDKKINISVNGIIQFYNYQYRIAELSINRDLLWRHSSKSPEHRYIAS